MLEENLIQFDFYHKKKSKHYFAHYMTDSQFQHLLKIYGSWTIDKNLCFDSKHLTSSHKQLVHAGVNPNEIAKIIRNDDIENLQKIASQEDFDFNQIIEPTIYERYSFINHWNVSLICFAAFFGSIKCFKFLMLNGADLKRAGKYAIAGGNTEIFHICEQNHSTFPGSYITAIEFHRNKIFHYLYENKFNGLNNINELIQKCIKCGNFEIFSFLVKEMKIDDDIIKVIFRYENVFLIKDLHITKIPKDILVYMDFVNIDLVKYFLEYKEIDINAKDYYGNTALMKAFSNGHTEIVELLLEQEEIHVNAKDKRKLFKLFQTALILASKNGHTEIVKLLLVKEGIDVNAKDRYGDTALIWACIKGHTEIVKLLLEQEGIDINAKNNPGETALTYASRNGYIEIVKLLLKKEGIDVNAKNRYDGYTALILASKNGHTEIVKLLLEQEGIDISVKDRYDEETALIYASREGHTEIVKLLLKQEEIDVNAKNDKGCNALMIASSPIFQSLKESNYLYSRINKEKNTNIKFDLINIQK